jgi:predicted amidophosphoribosyltransferase
MKFETLLEKVKAALKSPICLHCEQKLQKASMHFCVRCRETLGVRQPKAVVDLPSFICHAATHFNPAIKKILYGYKFYNQEFLEPKLAGLLIDYWEEFINLVPKRVHPENILVVPIPSHHNETSKVEGFARRFSRHFGYDFRPGMLQWQRRIEPQHTIHEKQARFTNIAGSLQVNKRGLRGHEAIIILDDLTTTGATLHEANQALRQSLAHPEQMEIITLAVTKVPLGFYQ